MDSGNVEVAIRGGNGLVQLTFREPVKFVSMSPENALAISEAMAKESYKQRYGTAPAGALKTDAMDKKRTILINRVSIMLSGNLARKKPSEQAMAIVDSCMSELL